MRLKSYFAVTVESAIRLARQEMGEEAMLVSSRKAPADVRHLGAYEVVFAVAQDPAQAGGTAISPKVEQAAATHAPDLVHELAEMRRQLAKVSVQVSRSSSRVRRGSGAANAALDDLDEMLASQE